MCFLLIFARKLAIIINSSSMKYRSWNRPRLCLNTSKQQYEHVNVGIKHQKLQTLLNGRRPLTYMRKVEQI